MKWMMQSFKKLLIAMLFLPFSFGVIASTIWVSPEDNLQQKLDASVDGDIVQLTAGRILVILLLTIN